MMLELLKSAMKICSQKNIAIDNRVFRLHYKVTVPLLLFFSAILTAKQHFGDPIDCIVQEVPSSAMNTYCMIHGTRTIPHRGQYDEYSNPIYHTYYQWVWFTLLIQAVLFFFPRYLWKHMEGGRVKFCTKDMKEPELGGELQLSRVKRMMKSYLKFQGKNNTYALGLLFCEIINLMNVIIQIFCINKFIGGRFLDYGFQVLHSYIYIYDEMDGWIDPMAQVFPTVTSCIFNTFGPSGAMWTHDGLCQLPLNTWNEKIYVGMWWWLIVLAVASLGVLVYRATCLLTPRVRSYLLVGGISKKRHVQEVWNNVLYGDWFLLRQMSKNVDQETFKEFLKQLGKEVNKGEENWTEFEDTKLDDEPMI